MEFIKYLKICLALVFATQATALASSQSITIEDEIATFIEQADPDRDAVFKDVIVLGTESDSDSGKEFKTVRFTRIVKGVKSIITMKLEYEKNRVGPESEVLSVVNLTPKDKTQQLDLVDLHDSGPATNLFTPKPRKKRG